MVHLLIILKNSDRREEIMVPVNKMIDEVQ